LVDARHGLLLPRISGVLMLGVFSLNAYIGLKDNVLFEFQPTHQGLNFIIAVIDLIATSVLIYYAEGRKLWVLLSGIVWPIAYLTSLFADVESRMCLFTGQNCFSSVSVSFQYLILGQASQGWLLWPYTMLSTISLLTFIIVLSLISLVAA
jgi:hypothetical protein